MQTHIEPFPRKCRADILSTRSVAWRLALTLLLAGASCAAVLFLLGGCASQPNVAGADNGQDRQRVINNQGTLVLVENLTLAFGAQGQPPGSFVGPLLFGNLADTLTNEHRAGNSTASGSQTGATSQDSQQQGGPTSAEGTLQVPLTGG